MKVTETVSNILKNYEGMNTASKMQLARLLMHGRLGGTGKLIILPVDQGFEHGPARSFAVNPDAYDPHYLFDIAIEAGLSAYAAPLGMLEAGVETYAGKIPTILKINSANSWATCKSQAITASVKQAKQLGCVGVGYTIYPGSEHFFSMVEEFRTIAERAREEGMIVVLWSYPRGGNISKAGETSLDVTAYAAHMAALLGAHIIKVKPPTAHLEQPEAKEVYEKTGVPREQLYQRIEHIMQCSFASKRLVVFSGGGARGEDALLDEIRALHKGGASGSIIGRNTFQRPREEALKLLNSIINIYLG